MTQGAQGHAVVIGGSVAGLLAARVLSEHFRRVSVLERDPLRDPPEPRKGQPQARHLHVLLARGLQILSHYFPDLVEALRAEGAVVSDLAEGMHWYTFGGYRVRHTCGLRGVAMSRPFLECVVRQRVVALPNVTLWGGYAVTGLVAQDDHRVTGVKVVRRDRADLGEVLHADLVVDANGRGSRSGTWLAALGYPAAEERVVKVDVKYATRLYRRPADAPGARDWFFVTPEAPKERRLGGAFPIEGGRWIVSLCGWHGDHSPLDEEGFVAFAKELPAPDIYDLITRSEPLSGVVQHTFPSSLRRHYERLRRFPEGYLVLGDALCSFNPSYGQGMTSAALQAEALDALLRRRGRLAGLARPFFRRAARIIDVPWQMAVGEDFRFPETEGPKGFATDLRNAYGALVNRASHVDPVVCRSFLSVSHLVTPPRHLFSPQIFARVLWAGVRRGRAQGSTAPKVADG